MLFNSVTYVIFLPACVALYFVMLDKLKNVFLLAASYFFYMCWEPKYIALIFFSTVVTWGAGYLIEMADTENKRKLCLAVSIILNLSVLFLFKYYNFFAGIRESVIPGFNINRSSFLLPVGISFYTFQALGYAIDVYRGEENGGIKHERNFISYALLVSYFPQLVAGPIERSANLLPQIKTKQKFSVDNAVVGLRIILVGMFKKVVIADMIAMYVDQVYYNLDTFGAITTISAVFLFSIQIYCDFGGYSDIARGSAKIFGIDLMSNFNAPYFAKSIKDFWNRWHISLSTWFRDYLYFPLGETV